MAQKPEAHTAFARFLGHNMINTHQLWFLWTSDQLIAEAATYTPHNKQETNIHALNAIRTRDRPAYQFSVHNRSYASLSNSWYEMSGWVLWGCLQSESVHQSWGNHCFTQSFQLIARTVLWIGHHRFLCEILSSLSLMSLSDLSLEMTKKLMKSCIWSVALYGSETWTLEKKEKGS